MLAKKVLSTEQSINSTYYYYKSHPLSGTSNSDETIRDHSFKSVYISTQEVSKSEFKRSYSR